MRWEGGEARRRGRGKEEGDGDGGRDGRRDRAGDGEAEDAKQQLRALLAAVAALPPTTASAAREKPPRPPLMLGSMHEGLLPLLAGSEHRKLPRRAVLDRARADEELAERGGGGGAGVLTQISVRYGKWVFRAAAGGRERTALPGGYTFSAIREEELEVVVSRTSIPKTVGTLGRLVGVGVRKLRLGVDGQRGGGEGEGKLVAWGFLGTDGGLNTLHVEEEERGRGLGKGVGRELLRMAAGGRSEGQREVWVSGNVAVGNLESEGVMKGLGGERRWWTFWVGVDLGACGSGVGDEVDVDGSFG